MPINRTAATVLKSTGELVSGSSYWVVHGSQFVTLQPMQRGVTGTWFRKEQWAALVKSNYVKEI